MTRVRADMRVVEGCVRLHLKPHTTKKLVIDCKPFGPRPCDFLAHALHGTGLTCKPPETRVFGEWTFDFSEDATSEYWNKMLPVMMANLSYLYESGSIRYAEWTPSIQYKWTD